VGLIAPSFPVFWSDHRTTGIAPLPAGRTDAGLPVAVQLLGRRQGEARLCEIAAALQSDTRWDRAHPDLSAVEHRACGDEAARFGDHAEYSRS
jgi:hypothetical protein